jgi:DNA modification methylase
MARSVLQGLSNHEWSKVRAIAHLSSDHYAILIGDAVTQLRRLPPGCIDTCVTSPPYWSARDYGHSDQIGLEEEVGEYVERLVAVFAEVRRSLVETGTVWLNIGDTYFGGAGTVDGKPPERGWKRNKQLSLVPYRVALALQEDGWWVRNVLCWQKSNAMPSSVRDRLTNVWEPVFLLAKSERYYFDLDAIRVPHETDDQVERRRAERGENNGKARGKDELRRWLNSPRHRATIDGLKEVRIRVDPPDPTALAAYLRRALEKKGQTIHWVAAQLGEPFERTRHYFRTDRVGSRLPPEETWPRLKALLDVGPEYDEAMNVLVKDNVFRNHPNGKNPGDWLSMAAAGGSEDHFAVMPVSLAEWALKATLPPNGVCLDPFMGTGTTGIAALQLGGRFVGVDIQRRYACQFIERSHSLLLGESKAKKRRVQRPMKSNGVSTS